MYKMIFLLAKFLQKTSKCCSNSKKVHARKGKIARSVTASQNFFFIFF